MDRRRHDEWENDFTLYSANQVEGVLEYCDIEVVSDTSTNFLAYCPFHGNTDTPAFSVDKTRGVWMCFSPTCMESGNLPDLLRRVKGLNPFQSLRLIAKKRTEHGTPFSDRFKEAMENAPDFTPFPQETLNRLRDGFPGSVGEEYMKSRGFTSDTMEFFGVGYSAKNNMVTVPMHDPSGMPIGLIGRTASPEDKTFKNSTNLPKSKTAWNFHRAKTHGDTVIVCEASYDAMRIHQAGYPNVIALLGGHVTAYHLEQISRHFSKIVVMTDFDKKQYRPNCRPCAGIKFKRDEVRCIGHRPGRDLGRTIAQRLPNKKIMWAAFDDECVFPHGAKDASDMTDDEIRQCLRNAISNLQYSLWNIESGVAA